MPRPAMANVERAAARVALVNFLTSLCWTGPWASLGDGHCGLYAHTQCYSLPMREMQAERRRIARWIDNNLEHSVHRWSDLMRITEPLPLRPRKALMKRVARSVRRGDWLGAREQANRCA